MLRALQASSSSLVRHVRLRLGGAESQQTDLPSGAPFVNEQPAPNDKPEHSHVMLGLHPPWPSQEPPVQPAPHPAGINVPQLVFNEPSSTVTSTGLHAGDQHSEPLGQVMQSPPTQTPEHPSSSHPSPSLALAQPSARAKAGKSDNINKVNITSRRILTVKIGILSMIADCSKILSGKLTFSKYN